MNCPQCKCPVGNDQHYAGAWEPVYDDRGNVVDSRRGIAVSCDHCGLFEIEQDGAGRVRFIHGPYHNDRDVRRLERNIPAAKRDRRVRVA